MPKNISWKKGMRLSDDIFRTADALAAQGLSLALTLGAAGRFGLLPGSRPFRADINLGTDSLTVEALHCTAITRGGGLIDAHWESDYTATFDTRVPLPTGGQDDCLLLIELPTDGATRELEGGLCEPAYALRLIGLESPVPDGAMPIAHLVHDFAWHIDDQDFVPPCLFVSSHTAFREQLEKFITMLKGHEAAALAQLGSAGRDALALLLPEMRRLRIAADKQRDTLTPAGLLGLVQQCASAFVTGCRLCEAIELSDAADWENYIDTPHTVQNVYPLINQGLTLCATISDKVLKFPAVQAPPPPPQRPEPKRPEPKRPEPKQPEPPKPEKKGKMVFDEKTGRWIITV